MPANLKNTIPSIAVRNGSELCLKCTETSLFLLIQSYKLLRRTTKQNNSVYAQDKQLVGIKTEPE